MSTPLEVIQEGDRFGSLMNMTPDPDSADFVFFVKDMKDYSLALLQALRAELKGKKIEQKETETWDTELKTIVYGRRLEIQDQQDNLIKLIKELTK